MNATIVLTILACLAAEPTDCARFRAVTDAYTSDVFAGGDACDVALSQWQQAHKRHVIVRYRCGTVERSL